MLFFLNYSAQNEAGLIRRIQTFACQAIASPTIPSEVLLYYALIRASVAIVTKGIERCTCVVAFSLGRQLGREEKVLLAHASPVVPQSEGTTLYVEVVVLRKVWTWAKVCRTARRSSCIIL